MPTISVLGIGNNSTTGVIQPRFKVSFQALLHDFWDSTNQRYTSGVLVTTLTGISWGGSEVGAETATIRISPANYQQDANDLLILTADISSPSLTYSYDHVTAINYGMPDSSAVLNPDGTISLVNVDFEISSNAFTPIESLIEVTVEYTTVFTEYSPYGSTGGTLYTAALVIGPGSGANWGMVVADGPGTGVNQALVVQLSTLSWSVLPGIDPTGSVPQFQLSNPARPGDAVVANYNIPLAQTYGRSLTYYDNYTYIFAVNDGKVDANATPVQATGGQLFNLCNFGLTTADASGTDTATATLTYYIATHTL